MSLRNLLNNPNNFSGLHVLNTDEVKQLQETLTEVVNDLIPVFKKHNISWGITGGNALGAFRNNDFIPWDDDIDLNITREDFKKLVEVFDEELSDKYILKKPGDIHYVYHYPQIQKKGTSYKLLQSHPESNDGLFIDIFIIENSFDNRLINLCHGLLSSFLLFVDSCMRTHVCKKNILKYCVNNKVKKAIDLRDVFSLPFRIVRLENWLLFSDKCFQLCKNNQSKKTVIPSGANHFFGETFKREDLLPFKPVVFRNNKWFSLNNLSKYLSVRYGQNYMTPPPKEKQESHAVIDFKI